MAGHVTVDHGELPNGVELQRTTDTFTSETVPAGLLRAHRVAEGVWGRLRVIAGDMQFVWEENPDDPVQLHAGDSLVIPPGTPHRVVPESSARFCVEFHR